MSSNRKILLSVCLGLMATVFSSDCSAQLHRPMRWLGQGFSDGYHRCNPGPNSDYYDPYTVHNSLLIHQNPEAYGVMPNRYRSSGLLKPGVPFWEYASPKDDLDRPGFNSIPGNGVIDPSIAPSIDPAFGARRQPDADHPNHRFEVHWSNQTGEESSSQPTGQNRKQDTTLSRLKNIRIGQSSRKSQSDQRVFSIRKR